MKKNILRRSIVLALIMCLLSVPLSAYAASKPGIPVIKYFTVDKNNVELGDTVVLKWNVENATDIKILGLEKEEEEELPLCGSIEAWPMATTTYILIARGKGGTVSASVTVNVEAKGNVAIEYFTASSTRVVTGSTVVLSWKTSNAAKVKIIGLEKEEEEELPLCGSIEVWPFKTTTYILQATGLNGEVASKTLTVNVVDSLPAVIKSFTVSKNEIYEGESVKLSWEVQDAETVKINDTVVAAAGSMDVTPSETTTYTLKAVGTDGVEVSQSITVTVKAAPKITSFTASATEVEKGTLVTLSWTTENATGCVILTDDGIKLTNRPANGKIAITPNKTRTYTLVAYNADEVIAQQSITITVK